MLNAILSLTVTFGLPLPVLASWRGCAGEKILAHIPFNRQLPGNPFGSRDCMHNNIRPHAPHEIGEAITAAYQNRTPQVILFRPECLEETGCSVQSLPVRSSTIFRLL